MCTVVTLSEIAFHGAHATILFVGIPSPIVNTSLVFHVRLIQLILYCPLVPIVIAVACRRRTLSAQIRLPEKYWH